MLSYLEDVGDYVSESEVLDYFLSQTPGTERHEALAALHLFFANGVVTRRIDAGKMYYRLARFALKPSYRCDICKIDCNSVNAYRQHLQGHKHLANVHERETGSRDRTTWFTCGICSKRLNSAAQLACHMPSCSSKTDLASGIFQ